MSVVALTQRAATLRWSQPSIGIAAHRLRRCYTRQHANEKTKLDTAFDRLLQHHRNTSTSSHDDYEDALSVAKREWRWIIDEVRERRQAATLQHGQEAETVSQMVQRLVVDDEPMAYVLGHQPFGPLRIECAPPTLIPRSETEAMTEHVAERIVQAIDGRAKAPLRILDLCAGTGCMSLLIRHRLLQHAAAGHTFSASITAVDIASEAVALTKQNALLYENSALCADSSMQEVLRRGHVTFDAKLADVMDDAAMQELVQQAGPFDVLVCNPPYIPLHEWQVLDRSVREWEDRRALVGDVDKGTKDRGDGLDFYHRLAQLIKAGDLLRQAHSSDSALLIVAFEVGYDQAGRVASILMSAGLQNVAIWKDPFGIDRGVLSVPPI